MCGESANRCSPRVRARPSMRGQVGPDVQPPAPRLPGWRTTLLGAPRGKTALMRTKMAMESCSLMTRQHWTAACARRCAQMAWPWKIQHLHDVVLQPTRRKSTASKTPRESLPFARPLWELAFYKHRVTVNYFSQKPDNFVQVGHSKTKTEFPRRAEGGERRMGRPPAVTERTCSDARACHVNELMGESVVWDGRQL